MLKVRLKAEELHKAFKSVPNELDKAMVKAMTECSKVILNNCRIAYKKYFNVITGEAIDAIQISKINEKKVEIKLDPKVKHAMYLHEGTKAHWIEPKKADALAWIGNNGEFCFSQGHAVSGIKGHKFLEEGLNMSKAECEKIISKHVNAAMDKLFKGK